MKCLRQCYNNWSVFRKIVTWMMVVSMLPLCVMVMFDVAKIIDMETANTQSEIINSLRWIENDVSDEISELRLQAIRVSLNETVQAELENNEDSANMNLYEMKKSLFNISLSTLCHSAYILNDNGLRLSNYTSDELDAMMTERLPEFRQQLEQSKKTFVWCQPLQLGSVYLLPYVRSVETRTDGKFDNLFIANYPESSLESITRNTMKHNTMDIMKMRIVKIVLQPVVENALEYGVKKSANNRSLITIQGWREEDLLIFEVSDNCDMLTERRMKEVNERLQSEEPAPEAKAGIGLKNVNDRICYAFPEDPRVGVCLMKRNGKTVTRVTLKVMEEQAVGTV